MVFLIPFVNAEVPSVKLNETVINQIVNPEYIPTIRMQSPNYTSNLSGLYVLKTGDTMTGNLSVTGKSINFGGALTSCTTGFDCAGFRSNIGDSFVVLGSRLIPADDNMDLGQAGGKQFKDIRANNDIFANRDVWAINGRFVTSGNFTFTSTKGLIQNTLQSFWAFKYTEGAGVGDTGMFFDVANLRLDILQFAGNVQGWLSTQGNLWINGDLNMSDKLSFRNTNNEAYINYNGNEEGAGEYGFLHNTNIVCDYENDGCSLIFSKNRGESEINQKVIGGSGFGDLNFTSRGGMLFKARRSSTDTHQESDIFNFTNADVNVEHNLTANFYYGQMNASHVGEVQIVAQNVYSNVTNMSLGTDTNGFELIGNHTLIVKKKGVYSVNAMFSFSGNANQEYHSTLAKNGVIEMNNCHSERVIGSGGDVGTSGFTCQVRFEKDDFINLMMENVDSAGNPTVHDVNINLVRIGN